MKKQGLAKLTVTSETDWKWFKVKLNDIAKLVPSPGAFVGFLGLERKSGDAMSALLLCRAVRQTDDNDANGERIAYYGDSSTKKLSEVIDSYKWDGLASVLELEKRHKDSGGSQVEFEVKGAATYTDDLLATVDNNVKEHLAHGDTNGPCPGDASVDCGPGKAQICHKQGPRGKRKSQCVGIQDGCSFGEICCLGPQGCQCIPNTQTCFSLCLPEACG